MIYFDAAATTMEKPATVRRAAVHAINGMSSPGRGDHPATREAEETAFRCRTEAAELFGVEQPENVIFTFNATHGLNVAIRSLVHPGSRVVISGYEHNAVTRPLCAIDDVTVTVVDTPLFRQSLAKREFEATMEKGCDVVICNHVSNVFGCVQPLSDIAVSCRRCNVPLIVDASQSAGVLPVRMDELGAAFIAMPGHKGLYGPQGTGLLLCRDRAEPLLYGGTGTLSRDRAMPPDLPERLEAGTQNVCGAAGLRAGMRYLRTRGVSRIRRREEALLDRLIAALQDCPELELFLPARDEHAGVLSLRPRHRDTEELAAALGEAGVAVRAGLQCAPLAHETAGTIDTGTVRLSLSPFLTPDQIDRAAGILIKLLKNNYKM